MARKVVKINPEAINLLPEFLRKKIEENGDKEICVYDGPTHGCIMRGIPVTLSPGQQNAVFYELPREAVVEQKIEEKKVHHPKEAMSFF